MTHLPPSIDQIVDAQAESMLERLEGSALLEAGKLHLVGLNSIKARLGDRWTARTEQVHDHVRRSLTRALGDDGYFVQISQTDYLVVQPDRERHACQAACLRFMRELLAHFLGEAAAADIDVREVTSLRRDRVEARLVDPSAPAPHVTESSDQDDAPDMESPDHWSPFVASGGQPVHVSCVLEPVLALGALQQVGFRLTRRVLDADTRAPLTPEQHAQLRPGDLERIDLAAIARGMSRARSEVQSQNTPMLQIPVSYATLTTRRGHGAVQAYLRGVRGESTTRAVCEIRDLEGVPLNALFNTVSMLRRTCYAVMGCLNRPPDRSTDIYRSVGFNGVAFAYVGPRGDDAAMIESLTPDIALLQGLARSTMVLGLRSPKEAALARLAGATHATLRNVA